MASPVINSTTAGVSEQWEEEEEEEEEEEGSSSAATSRGACRFPQSFQVYYEKSNLSTTIFHLAEERSQPLYTAALHLGWFGKSDVTLYDSVTAGGPVLATAHNERRVGLNSTIKIHPAAPQSSGVISERLKVNSHARSDSYTFVVPAGTGSSAYPEKFEWRPSRSQQITADSRTACGWKLVRLDAHRPTSTVAAGDAAHSVTASGGGEVVAVLIDTTGLRAKVAQFKFLGTGATGELGETWAMMAVVTALRIWQMRWFLSSA